MKLFTMSNNICSICFNTGKVISIPCCKQLYHVRCLNEWFEKCNTNNMFPTCPTCRNILSYKFTNTLFLQELNIIKCIIKIIILLVLNFIFYVYILEILLIIYIILINFYILILIIFPLILLVLEYKNYISKKLFFLLILNHCVLLLVLFVKKYNYI
jgi:hypothetical protein